QVVKGEVTVNGEQASTSDAFAIWDEPHLHISADSAAEILLFDLPAV
ncbi:pirin family protein, partial [Erwinia oleae]